MSYSFHFQFYQCIINQDILYDQVYTCTTQVLYTKKQQQKQTSYANLNLMHLYC